ncbi:MAG: hypothetical protein JNM56_33080 [Planctomycetia bacterium]|nr:hypothetical protein [Planctomycetia bacterium]
MKKPAKPKIRVPAAPNTLGAEGRKLWRRIAEDYDLDAAALVILESACLSQDRESGASAQLVTDGTTTTDRFGQVKAHPAVLIERDSRAAKLRALKQLNLDMEPLNDKPGRPAGR